MILSKINQCVFSFETKNNVVIKQHIINNILRIYYDFQDKDFVQWSLYAGNKKRGTSFKWSLIALYRWLLCREKFDLKT